MNDMIISFSEVNKWDQCKRAYYYNFTKNLRPLEESDPITTGGKGHKLLQTFYTAMQNGFTKEDALEKVKLHASKLLEENKFTDLLKAWILVNNYIETTDFISEVVLVENRFQFPAHLLCPEESFFEGIQIGFTPDVVFKRKGGFHDVEDAKFVGRAWSQKKLNRFPQAKLYQIFLRRMGYNVSRSSIRFFNTSTNKVTVQNAELKQEEETNLLNDFLDGVVEVAEYRKNLLTGYEYPLRRTMNYATCQYCAFEEPCTLEAQGKDASKTFKYQFTEGKYDYSR